MVEHSRKILKSEERATTTTTRNSFSNAMFQSKKTLMCKIYRYDLNMYKSTQTNDEDKSITKNRNKNLHVKTLLFEFDTNMN